MATALLVNALLPGGRPIAPEADIWPLAILPRLTPPDSGWRADWPESGLRASHADLIGNLALTPRAMSRPTTSATSDLGFDAIRNSLSHSDMPALSRDAANAARWTPEAVRARTARLVGLIAKAWALPPPSTAAIDSAIEAAA